MKKAEQSSDWRRFELLLGKIIARKFSNEAINFKRTAKDTIYKAATRASNGSLGLIKDYLNGAVAEKVGKAIDGAVEDRRHTVNDAYKAVINLCDSLRADYKATKDLEQNIVELKSQVNQFLMETNRVIAAAIEAGVERAVSKIEKKP